MSNVKNLTLAEAKNQLRMNRSLYESLKGNTPIEDMARFREVWLEPLEGLIKELDAQRGGAK